MNNGTVNVSRAAKITGYSTTSINRAMRDGALKYEGETKKRNTRVNRDVLLAWAEEHKKKGGLFLPRPRKKKREAAAPSANGSIDSRLTALLKRLAGTALEMTGEEFVRRAIERAVEVLPK